MFYVVLAFLCYAILSSTQGNITMLNNQKRVLEAIQYLEEQASLDTAYKRETDIIHYEKIIVILKRMGYRRAIAYLKTEIAIWRAMKRKSEYDLYRVVLNMILPPK